MIKRKGGLADMSLGPVLTLILSLVAVALILGIATSSLLQNPENFASYLSDLSGGKVRP